MADTLLDVIGRIVTFQEEDEAAVRYVAMLAPEGVMTSDHRIIEDGALSWRSGRLPLMWSDTEQAHGDAVLVGNLENLRFETIDGTKWVVADIDWDTRDEAVEAKRLVDEDRLTGVSVHMADIDADIDCPDEDDEPCVMTVTMGVIAAATIVAIPAFEDAEIEAVAAAATPIDASLYSPPRAWFDDPQLDGPTPLTVTSEGRIFGHLALWDSCHLGFEGVCVTPPRDAADYAEFHAHGRVHTEEGALLPVGAVTVEGTHADLSLNVEHTARHYDSTATVGAYVRAGDDEHGPWVAGALAPGLDPAVVEKLRRLSLSGDWRPRNGRFVLAAVLTVPVPGFSVTAHVAAGEQTALLTLGPLPEIEEPTDLALVASAIGDLRSVIGEFRTDLEPLLAEYRTRELEEVFAAFDVPNPRG